MFAISTGTMSAMLFLLSSPFYLFLCHTSESPEHVSKSFRCSQQATALRMASLLACSPMSSSTASCGSSPRSPTMQSCHPTTTHPSPGSSPPAVSCPPGSTSCLSVTPASSRSRPQNTRSRCANATRTSQSTRRRKRIL